MKKIFFTPGPTELYPEVKNYIGQALDEHVCSINHRSNEFVEIYKFTVDNLKKLLSIPSANHVFFLSSATECMDRIIQNTVIEKSFHYVNGAFAERFYKTAVELGKKADKVETIYGEGFDFMNIEIQNDPELICITQNETSTGVAINPENIYCLKKSYPDSIIAVDIVTSSPYVNLDYDKIDCAFFSVQKGFGLPAGLGVLIINEQCMKKAFYMKSKNINIGCFHNFISLYENAIKHQTSETPNVLGIYLLGKVCEQLNKYGIDKVRKETEDKADTLYNFFEAHQHFKPFVKDNAVRSKTIINIEVGERQGEVKKLLSDEGILVGSGYGMLKDTQIRIANFPMHQLKDVKSITEILK